MTPDILIGFCKGTALLSRIIEWFTGGGPSHVFILYRSEDFGGWVSIGSEAKGWIPLPAESMENVTDLYSIPGLDLRKGLRASRPDLCANYDIGGLLGMSWVMVAWRFLGKKVRNPLLTLGAWFCSEAAALVVRRSDGILTLGPGETDPLRFQEEIVSVFSATKVTDRAAYPVKWK